MKITFWSDYMCPYCYIGETNLSNALKNMNLTDKVELEMKAYELDPYPVKESEVDPVKSMAKKYGMPEEKAAERIEAINRAGRKAGIDMHADKVKRANTFDAHRLTKYAQSLGNQEVTEKLMNLIFKSAYTIGANISDHDVLLKIAQEAGLKDLDKVKKVLNSTEFGNEVKYDEREAYKEGVRGVPYFVIGDKVLPGAYDVEEFEKVIRSQYDKAETLTKEAHGVTCTAEGCTVK